MIAVGSAQPIVSQIEEMVRDVPGWTPLDQLTALFTLAYASPVEGDIIELGSWCGRSAATLGLAANLSGGAQVHAIDLFPEQSDWRQNPDGTFSFAVTIGDRTIRAYDNPSVWPEPYWRDIAPVYTLHGGVLPVFQRVMAANGLADIVRPFRGTLDMFVDAAPHDLRCKLAFIDGDHSYDAVCRDIEDIERFVVRGGWVCFDDAFSSYEGVDRAILDRVVNSGRYERCHQVTRKLFAARRNGRP